MKSLLKLFCLGILLVVFVISLSVGLFTYFRPQSMIELLSHLTPTVTPSPIQIKGIGVIGDSLSDEYRADDSRGETYASTTLNWVEVLQKTRNLPFGKWQYWEEPRRQGYEYDFARTAATIAEAVRSGQHTGLAQEIKAGKVNVAIVFIGANDFFPYTAGGYESIYNGSLTEADITAKVNRMVADETTIIETLQSAGDVRILLVKVPDWGHHPGAIVAFPDPRGRERVSRVIEQVNSQFEQMAKANGIATADPNDFYDQIASHEKNGELTLAGVKMDELIPSDDPHSLFLDDFVHPGTVYNGLFANFLVEKMNSQLGISIKPLSDAEIRTVAGL